MFVSKMESTTEEVVAAKKPPLEHENKFKSSLHSKRETISKIIGVSSGPTYVYIVVSKDPSRIKPGFKSVPLQIYFEIAGLANAEKWREIQNIVAEERF